MKADIISLLKIFSDRRFREIAENRASQLYGDEFTEENMKEVLKNLSSEISEEYQKQQGCRDGNNKSDFAAFAKDWIDKNYRDFS